jgi:ribosomal-protein-serine acetyltransferase
MLTHPVADAELRMLEPWQATEFASYVAEHRAHLAPWLPWAESIRDEEAARAFLQRYADGTAADGQRIYGLWREGRLLGGALFRVFDARASVCEIGVWLSADAQGQGLVTRAVEAMIAWAVDERGIHRVEWHCVPENAASRAVAVRLGFTHEGTARESWRYRDRWWDTEVWALLATTRRA